MLFLGHMGVGARLSRLISADLPIRWILLGSILPDLIDKPLFHFLHWVDGTRAYGHTGILFALLAAMALFSGSRALFALWLGMATHLALDLAGDPLEMLDRGASVKALLFPFEGGFRFNSFGSLSEHIAVHAGNPYTLGCEGLGAALLAWEARRAWLNRRSARRPDP